MEESLERYVKFLREIGIYPIHCKKIVIKTYDDNEMSKVKFVYLRCFKAKWEMGEAK